MRKQGENFPLNIFCKSRMGFFILFLFAFSARPVLFAAEPAAVPAEEAVDETTLNKRLSLIEKRIHAIHENQKLIASKQPDVQSELQSLKVYLHRHRSGKAPRSPP